MKNLILTGGIFHPFEKSSEAIYKLLLKEGIDSEIFENIEEGQPNPSWNVREISLMLDTVGKCLITVEDV